MVGVEHSAQDLSDQDADEVVYHTATSMINLDSASLMIGMYNRQGYDYKNRMEQFCFRMSTKLKLDLIS